MHHHSWITGITFCARSYYVPQGFEAYRSAKALAQREIPIQRNIPHPEDFSQRTISTTCAASLPLNHQAQDVFRMRTTDNPQQLA